MKQTIKLSLTAILLLTGTIYSKDDIVQRTDAYIDESRKLTGDIFSSASDGKIIKDKKNSEFDTYMDTVIWNDTLNRKTKSIQHKQEQPIAADSLVLDTPFDTQEKLYNNQIKKLDEAQARLSENNATLPSIFAGGYCSLHDTLKISKSYEFSRLDCLLDMGKGQYQKVEVFTSFYPDYKREMVIALPIYATFENQSRATFNGVVMNESKTSFDLASWVDNQRIQKLVGEGMLAVNDITYNYVNGYLRAKQASRIESSIDYVGTTNSQNGNGAIIPVRTTRTTPPDIKDYVIGGTVQIFTSLASIFGRDYLYSKTPLFAVYPQRIYIEGVLSFDNKGLAKQFGRIAQDQEKRSNANNKEWEQKKSKTIQKYNIRRSTTPAVTSGTGGIR